MCRPQMRLCVLGATKKKFLVNQEPSQQFEPNVFNKKSNEVLVRTPRVLHPVVLLRTN
jgi:hypothetical protein